MLLGKAGVEKLKAARVAVFGVGGVGGFVVEALARSGVGALDIVDGDVVDVTNLNRQIVATADSVGMPKVLAFAERLRAIAPETKVTAIYGFYLADPTKAQSDAAGIAKYVSAEDFDFSGYDYVVDAIDTVSAKLDIIEACTKAGTPVISAMGCGNRLDPTKLIVTDIFKTEMDPLAKVVRQELRKRGIKKLKVVASKEQPLKPQYETGAESDAEAGTGSGSAETSAGAGAGSGTIKGGTRRPPGSVMFVPGAAGLIIASEVVRDLCGLA